MKFTIRDALGNPWSYDTDTERFYLDDPEVEEEMVEQNGYQVMIPSNIDVLLFGLFEVAEFDHDEAHEFHNRIMAFIDWKEEMDWRSDDPYNTISFHF